MHDSFLFGPHAWSTLGNYVHGLVASIETNRRLVHLLEEEEQCSRAMSETSVARDLFVLKPLHNKLEQVIKIQRSVNCLNDCLEKLKPLRDFLFVEYTIARFRLKETHAVKHKKTETQSELEIDFSFTSCQGRALIEQYAPDTSSWRLQWKDMRDQAMFCAIRLNLFAKERQTLQMEEFEYCKTCIEPLMNRHQLFLVCPRCHTRTQYQPPDTYDLDQGLFTNQRKSKLTSKSFESFHRYYRPKIPYAQIEETIQQRETKKRRLMKEMMPRNEIEETLILSQECVMQQLEELRKKGAMFPKRVFTEFFVTFEEMQIYFTQKAFVVLKEEYPVPSLNIRTDYFSHLRAHPLDIERSFRSALIIKHMETWNVDDQKHLAYLYGLCMVRMVRTTFPTLPLLNEEEFGLFVQRASNGLFHSIVQHASFQKKFGSYLSLFHPSGLQYSNFHSLWELQQTCIQTCV